MFGKVLIANRGEIAVRVVRACHELGVQTVTVYSDADTESLHVRYADEAYPLGPSPPAESYLNIEKIVSAALQAGADAIHPGYGFLAENHEFAEACEKRGIAFIGPPSSTLRLTGDKIESRRIMRSVGVPTLPGGDRLLDSVDEASSAAEETGWPVLLKSAYGGGGRGIRIVRSRKELQDAFDAAERESLSAFGKRGVYVEKYLENPRHIEFQIISDRDGNTIHLGERECSIQRRFQKLIEISPSPLVDPDTRHRVGALAVKAAKAVSYVNAGTVEFVVDERKNFYFIEVNARLQVEHPVTELVTGVDLVKAQIRIACGEDPDAVQAEVQPRGWAIECRINAEDPYNNFLPSSGVVSYYHQPGGPGVRVDTALYSGYDVPTYYDSLVAKLVTYGRTFEEARGRMRNALAEYLIEGIATTIPLHKVIIDDPYFARGVLSTSFLETRVPDLAKVKAEATSTSELQEVAAAAAAVYLVTRKGKDVPPAPVGGSREVVGWRRRNDYTGRSPPTPRYSEDL